MQDYLGDRLDAAAAAKRGERRRIARAGRGAEHVRGDGAHDVHVLGRGPRVLAGQVGAVQLINEAAERLEVGGAVKARLVDGGGGPDDRLAAAVGEAGDRGLVAHGAGQASDIVDGLLLVLVDTHAAAADGRPEPGRVQRDERPQSSCRIGPEVELTVPKIPEDIKNHTQLMPAPAGARQSKTSPGRWPGHLEGVFSRIVRSSLV